MIEIEFTLEEVNFVNLLERQDIITSNFRKLLTKLFPDNLDDAIIQISKGLSYLSTFISIIEGVLKDKDIINEE